MNLDLLIKLVKLANNNPNDNEANLAARKVCKMIAEAKYQFANQIKTEPTIKPRTSGFSTPYGPNPYADYMKNGSWYGFDWNKEAQRAKENYRPSREQENFYKKGNPFDYGSEPVKSQSIPCTKCGYTYTVSITIKPSEYVCKICQLQSI